MGDSHPEPWGIRAFECLEWPAGHGRFSSVFRGGRSLDGGRKSLWTGLWFVLGILQICPFGFGALGSPSTLGIFDVQFLVSASASRFNDLDDPENGVVGVSNDAI